MSWTLSIFNLTDEQVVYDFIKDNIKHRIQLTEFSIACDPAGNITKLANVYATHFSNCHSKILPKLDENIMRQRIFSINIEKLRKDVEESVPNCFQQKYNRENLSSCLNNFVTRFNHTVEQMKPSYDTMKSAADEIEHQYVDCYKSADSKVEDEEILITKEVERCLQET